MRLLADRAVAHRAGVEALDDLADRLDLLQRHRRARVRPAQLEQAAQRHEPLGLLVDPLGVLLEDVVAPRPGGVLQPEDGVGVEQVRLALAAPLVLTAHLELAVREADAVRGVCRGVPGRGLRGEDVEPDAAELRHGAGEVGVDQVLRETEGLEHLGAAVGGDRRDAHLGHHLEHALAEGLDEVGDRLVRGHAGDGARTDEVLDRLHGEVGVDRGCAVAHQQRHVVHLAHVAGLDQQPDLGAGLLADQVVVHRGGQQQRRDGGEVAPGVAVGQDHEAGAADDGLGDLGEDLLEPGLHGGGTAGDVVQPADHVRGIAGQVAVRVDVHDLGEVVVVDHRERQHDLAGVAGEAVRARCPPGRSRCRGR